MVFDFAQLFSRQIGDGTAERCLHVRKRRLDLDAHLPAAEADGLADGALVKEGRERLFHAEGRTAAVHVPRQREQLLLREHLNGLLPRRLRRLF